MATKLSGCKQGPDAIVYCELTRYGWVRFSADFGIITDAADWPLQAGGFVSGTTNWRDTSDHGYFLTALSYRRQRTNTGTTTTFNVAITTPSTSRLLHFTEDETETVDRKTGVHTGAIIDETFPSGSGVSNNHKLPEGGPFVNTLGNKQLYITKTSETLTSFGRVRTRTYDYQIYDNFAVLLDDGTITETDTQSDELDDTTLRGDAEDLLDAFEAGETEWAIAPTSGQVWQVLWDGSGDPAWSEALVSSFNQYCNPVAAGVRTPLRAVFVAGPVAYAMSRYKATISAGVYSTVVAGISAAHEIDYTILPQPWFYEVGGINGFIGFNSVDGHVFTRIPPTPWESCGTTTRTPCSAETVRITEPSTAEAGSSIYGIRFLRLGKTCADA